MTLSDGLKIFLIKKPFFFEFTIRMSMDPEQMHGFLLTQAGKTLWDSCAHKKSIGEA